MNKHPPVTEEDQPRGVILVIVLWTVAMMTVVIAALSTNVRTSASLAGTETRRLSTEMLLQGGIDVAAATLIASGDNIRTVSDGHATAIDLGNGNIAEMKIRDAAGLIDLNRAEEALLAGIIAHATESEDTGKAMAQQIVQWRSGEVGDADSQPAAFISVAQLYNIKDMDPKVVAGFLPFVGLYSKEGRINLTAAPDEVIASIPEIKPAEIDMLIAARNGNDWDNNNIKSLLDDYDDYVTLDPTNVFMVDLELVQTSGLILGTHLKATIMIDKSADIPFHVISRSW